MFIIACVTESPGKEPKTGILNSIAFYKIPTVEFVAISSTVRGSRNRGRG
jgi:hypothetical protein